MSGSESDGIMLQVGWENAKSVGYYLVIHGWAEVKNGVFLLNAHEWKVTANTENYPQAQIAIHNPVGGLEGHCSFDLTLPAYQEAFASEVEFWRRCAHPNLREMAH